MMLDNVLYEKIVGNSQDKLAVNNQIKRLSQGGMFICIEGEAKIVLDESIYDLKKNNMVIYFVFFSCLLAFHLFLRFLLFQWLVYLFLQVPSIL